MPKTVSIEGIEFSGVASGIKAEGLDLGLVVFREETNVLAVYTRNQVKAAHILYDRRIDKGPVRALVANSGCANACTGKEGVGDLTAIASGLAPLIDANLREILFASTGVIGKRLPTDAMISALPRAARLRKESGLMNFARAIMTTDTYPKIAHTTFRGRKTYTIAGVAKGSGMINPLFATMLAFVFTDFPVSPETVRLAFSQAVKDSFERITVDGECSTNDTVMLFTRRGQEDTDALETFTEGLRKVLKELSMMVVRDGEGASRVAHIMVEGARKKEWAEKIARRIALSPLTKTAFFGADPNWGRIIAAAGDAGVPLNPSKVDITLQGEMIAKGGAEIAFSEKKMKKLMNRKEISVIVDLNDGKASFDIYTTDLTYDYVKINASYRS
ncbi:MAG: Arginine biosynthesis bifunctional protein ArgJ [Syntrophorhabdus sp. PtaB.Bin184]|jgi:glutamate N-acetyltransferase/amino-acid N-acetyltransferase|nr:MAG: Arginine biosynthesis bifunctional protein ArgJ [Syntrophorhabdus sp. PtaB.Bin184]